jgi:hypothetical protein
MAGIWYFRDERLAFCAAQRHIVAARHCDLYPTPLPFLGVSSLNLGHSGVPGWPFFY